MLLHCFSDIMMLRSPISLSPARYPTFEKVPFRAKIADARRLDSLFPMRGRFKGLENSTVKLDLALDYVKGIKMTPKWGK